MLVGASIGMARHALLVIAAKDRQATDHVVAGLDVGNLAADFFDDSGGLVAEHSGCGIGIETIDEVEVAMAYATCDGFDQDFAILRLVEFDVLDTEGQFGPVENCGFHSGCSLSAKLWMRVRAIFFSWSRETSFTTTVTRYF